MYNAKVFFCKVDTEDRQLTTPFDLCPILVRVCSTPKCFQFWLPFWETIRAYFLFQPIIYNIGYMSRMVDGRVFLEMFMWYHKIFRKFPSFMALKCLI